MIIKNALPLFLIFSSQLSFAASDKITPANKANIVRHVGESVYFECKKLGPFSKECHVNCGNGKRFRKTSGYCFYLSEGSYTLSVSARYRNRDLLHTANVIVSEKSRSHRAASNKIGPGKEFTASTARHITPSIPSASVPSTNPSNANSNSGSTSITETQFNNDAGNQALQNTISNAINVQNQEQMISNIANDSLNTNDLSTQSTLNEINTMNNSLEQSPQFNTNTSSGSINNNTGQNNNQVSFN